MATYYWVGGSGTWDNANTTNWSASTGGAGGSGPPVSGDVVNFDANSGTAATVTVAATAACTTCIINKSDITLSLSGSPTFAGTTTFTAGTIALNSNTLTVNAFSSNNSNTRSLDFGTGKIVVPGNNTNVWGFDVITGLTVSGTPVVDFTYAGAVGTRNIRHGSSGGSTQARAISLNIKAGTDIVVIFSGPFQNIDFTGYAGLLGRGSAIIIYGNLTLSTGMTYNPGNDALTFGATSGTNLITTNGVTMDSPVTFNGVGGTWRLEDNLTLGSTRALTLTNGTLNANNKNVSIGTFATAAGGAKVLTMGSSTWTVAGTSWNTNTDAADVTVNAGTSTISMTSGSAKTFSGGGKTFNVLNQGGAGNLTIAQSNTFANITNTVQPATIRLTASTTQTVSAFSVSGTSGNLITLDTTVAGTQATLSDPSGLVSVSFCSIKDINATGGAFWQAYTVNGNVDGGNNLGWDFNAAAWSYMYNVRKSKRILPGV